MSPCAEAANLSMSASFCAGSVAALMSFKAWSASEPAGMGTNLPICWAQVCAPASTMARRRRNDPRSLARRIGTSEGVDLAGILVLGGLGRQEDLPQRPKAGEEEPDQVSSVRQPLSDLTRESFRGSIEDLRWSERMDLGLRGRVAIVAAASQGLGRAVAEELAREGANIAVCARTAGTLWETASQIQKSTGREVFH